MGKTTWEGSLNCLRPRGMAVFFGNASGPVPAIAPLALATRGSLFMTRPSLAHYAAKREELLQRASDVLGWVSSGKVKATIGETFPLPEAAEAQRKLAARLTSGKLLLLP